MTRRGIAKAAVVRTRDVDARYLIGHLTQINKRERFHVLKDVLGLPTQSLQIGTEFRKRLGNAIGATVPERAYAVVEYQLYRIEEALCKAFDYDGGEYLDHKSSMDVDLLVVFQESDTIRVVMVEAKYGTGWTNGQVLKKASRLVHMFGVDLPWSQTVRPSFVLLSPNRPQRLKTSGWPEWMAPRGDFVWMRLES